MNISPARVASYEILRQIETDGAFSANLLPQYEDNLDARDASLTHELVLGVLRKQIFLDRIVDTLANSRRLDIEVRIALRLALYQLKFLDRVPAHSALNESVELVKYAKKRSATGFVNALLRRASRDDYVIKFDSEMDRMSIETSHPSWLLTRWTNAIGQEGATALAIANNEAPAIDFRLTAKGRSGGINLDQYQQSRLAPGSHRSERLDEELRALAADGLIYFQDAGSQMVANSIELSDGERFLDVCASPGGKSTAIAARFPRSLIFAGDLTERRTETLRNLVAKQDADVSIARYDAVKGLPFVAEAFHTVLIDAPCSGTGTIRHNPEIRYRVSEGDFERLPELQLQILDNSASLVKKGGVLIYSTCSLEPEENEQVVAAFLSRRDDFEMVEPTILDELVSGDRTARTWPHLHGTDGFFVAALRRR